MNIIVGCEISQEVTKAFRDRGHNAFSCDILPCEGGYPEWHIQDDILKVINSRWDMGIFHPPCTYLANSGVRWLNVVDGKPTNLDRLLDCVMASLFFKRLLSAKIKKIAMENPIPHKYAGLPDYTQIIQPWMFGHGETKATCLWLKGLPALVPTNIVEGREQRIWKMPPGPDRQKLRSKTFQGIAEAMAAQWSV